MVGFLLRGQGGREQGVLAVHEANVLTTTLGLPMFPVFARAGDGLPIKRIHKHAVGRGVGLALVTDVDDPFRTPLDT